jgi:hypothetical protein
VDVVSGKPPVRTYRVQVTLTATVDASDTAAAATEVLRELWLRLPECELLVTVVTEVKG